MTKDRRKIVVDTILKKDSEEISCLLEDFHKECYRQARRQNIDPKQEIIDELGEEYFGRKTNFTIRRGGSMIYRLESWQSTTRDLIEMEGPILIPYSSSNGCLIDILTNKKACRLWDQYSTKSERYSQDRAELEGNLKTLTTVKKLLEVFPELEGRVDFAPRQNTAVAINFDKFKNKLKQGK